MLDCRHPCIPRLVIRVQLKVRHLKNPWERRDSFLRHKSVPEWWSCWILPIVLLSESSDAAIPWKHLCFSAFCSINTYGICRAVARQMQTADSLASNVSRARMSQFTVAEIMLARFEEHTTRNTLHWNLHAVVGNEATDNCTIPLIGFGRVLLS